MPLPDEPVAELTPEQIAANKEQAKADAAAQERAKVLSEYHSHPGVQLRALTKDMSSPGHDINDRVGAVQRGLMRLIQIVTAHTPEPPPHPDEVVKEEDHGEG